MQIKNEYVNINIGDKNYIKHNYFLNEYLIAYNKGQLSEYGGLNLNKILDTVYIKLDEVMEEPTRSGELSIWNFDLILRNPIIQQSGTGNEISTTYIFNDDIFYYNDDWGFQLETDKSLIIGKKITALSFGLKTFLDVSEYNIYIEEGQNINITRKDTFTSDAICTGYDFPYHLAPKLDDYTYKNDSEETVNTKVVAYLYSIGLGSIKGQMQEEYVIGDTAKIVNIVEDEENDIYSFDFTINKGGEEEVYPNESLYPSISIHPLLITINTSQYPMDDLYCGDFLYPTKSDYKYIMMKYRLGYVKFYNGVFDGIVDIGKEYVMNYFTNKSGLLTVTTKIERK